MNKSDMIIYPKEKRFPKKILENVKDVKPIYYQGDLSLLDLPAIGIVGSRKCTSYGFAVTKEIAKRAAERGAVVVSGLARGVDGAAHRAVLENGGKTIAVLGGGVDVIYPKENRAVYEEIKMKGLLISEYPNGAPAMKYNFPHRNRIISALSDAIVVVEAGTRSGSLITAECGIEQGKEVYAVPGNITSIYSMGPNKLIRDGAKALVVIEDLFSDLGLGGLKTPDSNNLGLDERRIMELIRENGEVSISVISDKTTLSISEINGILTVLEIKGLIYCEMGKVMIANFT